MSRRGGIAAGLAALALVGCGSQHVVSAPPPPAASAPVKPAAPAATAKPDESFRNEPPTAGQSTPFVPPNIQEARLPNGIRVLVVERHELPIVAVHLGVAQGADQATPGIGSFAGALLLSGTTSQSALQLSDALQGLGASYGASIDYDGGDVRGQVLPAKLPALLDLLGDVVQHPAFDPKEIERERANRVTAVAQEKDLPHVVMTKAAYELLYPARHPYRSSLLGEEPNLVAATRQDFLRFYRQAFRPPQVTVAFAGDITKDRAVAEATRVFGSWKGDKSSAATPAEPPAPKANATRLLLIDRPKAAQSYVAVTFPGVPRKSPDFDRLTVMNTLLGGQFSSRLNMNLREQHGYTYGASSRFEFRHGAGPFLASSAVISKSTADALQEMLTEIQRMRDEFVSTDELSDAQTGLVQKLAARFATDDATAESLAALSIYDLPLDEFATRPTRIRAVTREDVQRMAKTYLRPERLCIVVVGDAEVVQPGLAKLAAERGLKLEIRKAKDPAPANAKKDAASPHKI